MAFFRATKLDSVSAARKKQILFTMLGTEEQCIVDAIRLNEKPVPKEANEFSLFLTVLKKHFEFSGSVMLEQKKLLEGFSVRVSL